MLISAQLAADAECPRDTNPATMSCPGVVGFDLTGVNVLTTAGISAAAMSIIASLTSGVARSHASLWLKSPFIIGYLSGSKCRPTPRVRGISRKFSETGLASIGQIADSYEHSPGRVLLRRTA